MSKTIADIVIDLRSEPLAENGAKPWLHYLADQIEAAWKREREAGAEAAKICGEIGEMIGREEVCKQLVTNCNRFCNSAKMREALVKADAAFRLISKSAWFIDANFSETKKLMDAGNAIEVALAAPTRNCDRPECATTKEAQEVWSQEDGGKTAYYEWLLETSTKGETK